MSGLRSGAARNRSLPQLLRTDEVAIWLRTTTKAIYLMVERHQIPGVVHVGRRILFDEQVLVRWVDEKRAQLPEEE